MSYHPVALRQPSRARGKVSPNPLRSLRSLLMRKPPFIVEIPIVVSPSRFATALKGTGNGFPESPSVASLLLMRMPPLFVELNVVPPCFAPPRGVLGEALLLRSLTLRVSGESHPLSLRHLSSYHPVALRQPLCKWGVMIYSANFRPSTLFQRPRVKSGIFTGLLPFAMEAAVSSPRQDHSAAS